MPQIPTEDNNRMSVRIQAEEKSLLMRAGALKNMTLTDFVIKAATKAAREVIEEAGRIKLSERDSLQLLNLLENPPKPNKKLLVAAKELPESI